MLGRLSVLGDVQAQIALSSDGVTLFCRGEYGCVGICTAGLKGDDVFTRLVGRVDEREWDVDGGVVGGYVGVEGWDDVFV